MEVKDIFDIRKEGRTEEAYRAICQIYAHHHGPHTNLCMFWCSSDMFKKSAKTHDIEAMRQMLGNMVKIYPEIKDEKGEAARSIARAAVAMDKEVKDFNLIYFMPWFDKLTDEDWKPYTVNNHQVPSLGQQVVNHLMKDIQTRDIDYINKVADLFRQAMQKAPGYKLNLRHMAQLHIILGQSDKALQTYKRLLRRYKDAYLFAELASIVNDETQKMALFCQAILHQTQEKFAAKYHLELGLLLKKHGMKSRAVYEFTCCAGIRKRHGLPITPFLDRQLNELREIIPVSQSEEQALYLRSTAVVEALIMN